MSSGFSKEVQAEIAFICCLTLAFVLKFWSNASWLMQSNVQFGYSKMRPRLSDFLYHPTEFIFFHFQPYFGLGCN
jgi:hypothetical protein